MKPPFPYFGGKRNVAGVVWERLGLDADVYTEPFAGSLAVLLARPGGAAIWETVNDIDGCLTNFWRAVRADPEQVAKIADYPVSEIDLHARHAYLIRGRADLTEKLIADPHYYDVERAAWWVWGACLLSTIGRVFNPHRTHKLPVTVAPLVWVARVHGHHYMAPFALRFKSTRVTPISVKIREFFLDTTRRTRLTRDGDAISRLVSRIFRRSIPSQVVQAIVCLIWVGVMASVIPRRAFADERFEHKSVNHARAVLAIHVKVHAEVPRADIVRGQLSRFVHNPARPAVVSAFSLQCPYGTVIAGQVVVVSRYGFQCSFHVLIIPKHTEISSGWDCYEWTARGGYSSLGKSATIAKANRKRERIWFSPHCLKPRQSSLFGADGQAYSALL